MRNLWSGVIGAGLLVLLSLNSNANKVAPLPDAGISDEKLTSLGAEAIPFLIGRLQEPKYEKHFRGTVDRLKVLAAEGGKPDPRIFEAFRTSVATNSQRETVPFETLMAMYDALGAIGYVGGEAGVDYLSDWVKSDRYTSKIRCRYGNSSAEAAARILRDGAVWGLGFSGDPKALKHLEEVSARKPSVPFVGVVKDAIQENTRVQEVGVREALSKRRGGRKVDQLKKR